jgi:PAS domain S-box-containing protein
LILENSDADYDLIVNELRRGGFFVSGHRVETESDYRGLLHLPPDIILMDYMLGEGFDAPRALEILLESGLDIPAIVLTGMVSEEKVVECMKRGAADYLIKDRLTRLGSAVARALEDGELRRQKRNAENDVRKANARFQHLTETTGVIPWELDPETWRFTYVGPHAASLFGYPVEDWRQEGFWDSHIHMDDPQDLVPLRNGACYSESDHDFTCSMTARDGATVHLHCVVKTAACDDAGARVFLGWMMNITELKKAQESLARRAEELSASNAELRQFASIASHDLKEPLRMVSFYTQLLAKRYKGKLDADADEFIGYAVEGATRMGDLIKNLLEYSRISAAKREVAPTDCEAVFCRSIENLRLALHECGAAVTHDPLPEVIADASQLGQLLQNLVGNAIKYRSSERPPRVHVSVREEPAEWVFSVRDNGIGIEAEYFDKIFLIFHQLHSREKYDGTGVGLAICRRILERHNGRIWVESEVGEGATFCFTIPKQLVEQG